MKHTVRHEWIPGPKNGQPLCPCQIRDGRYVRVQDLGPVVDDWYFDTVTRAGAIEKLRDIFHKVRTISCVLIPADVAHAIIYGSDK